MIQAHILPKLKLGVQLPAGGVKTTGKHHVKLIEEKAINGKEFSSGKIIPMMRYIFEEDGEQKKYDARMKDKDTGELHYFVQSMADIKEGDEVILEMIKKGAKNVIIVQPVGDKSEVELEEEEELEEVENGTPSVQLGE